MRVEGSTYLPVPGIRRNTGITPVQQVVLPKEELRNPQLDRPRGPSVDDGFEDALMQVSVPDIPHSRIAMLYEVQRLAQGPVQAAAGGTAFQAALAYGTSVARQYLEQHALTPPVIRV